MKLGITCTMRRILIRSISLKILIFLFVLLITCTSVAQADFEHVVGLVGPVLHEGAS